MLILPSKKHTNGKAHSTSSGRRANSLGVGKHLLGIPLGFNLLQPLKVAAPIHLLRPLALKLGIRVVDVHAPLALLHRLADALAQSLEQGEALSGVRAIALAVVELEQEELVAVRVGRIGVLDLRDGAALKIHQDVPRMAARGVGDVGSDGINKGFNLLLRQSLDGQTS